MSAELLRRAAARMRADAQIMMDGIPPQSVWRSWTPTVALAVADWLDEETAQYEKDLRYLSGVFGHIAAPDFTRDYASPIAVARAYLGEQP